VQGHDHGKAVAVAVAGAGAGEQEETDGASRSTRVLGRRIFSPTMRRGLQRARVVMYCGWRLRLLEDIIVLTCVCWVIGCSLGMCPVGACVLGSGGGSQVVSDGIARDD